MGLLDVSFTELDLDQMRERLEDGEELVAYMNWGIVDPKSGVTTSYTALAFTAYNLYMFAFAVAGKGSSSTLKNFDRIPLASVKMVTVERKRASLERTKAHMSVVFNDNMTVTYTSREFDDAEAFANRLDQTQMSAGLRGAPTAASSTEMPPSGLAGQITELGKLHSEGILSDEEFTAAKQRLLAS